MVAGIFLLLLLLIYRFLYINWQPHYANRWLGIAGITLFIQLLIIYNHLPRNHRQRETEILPTFGLGNGLSLIRGLMLGLLTGFLFLPRPDVWYGWLPTIFYTIGSILDVFDGYAARITNHATQLGEQLDIEYDGWGVFLVTVLAWQYGQIPWWFVLLGLARHLFILGQWIRTRQGKVNVDLTPSVYRRIAAGLFISYLTVTLWPIVKPPDTIVAGLAYALPFGAIFLRDWLVVSKQINPQAQYYRCYWTNPTQFIVRWFPIFCRLTILVSFVWLIWQQKWLDWSAFLALFGFISVPLPASVIVALNLFTGITAVFTIAGILPRFTPIGVIFVAAGYILTTELSIWNGLLLFCTCTLTVLGGGPFTLWQPEEKILYQNRLHSES